MRKGRIIGRLLVVLALAVLIMLYWCNKIITEAAVGKLYNDADSIPYNKVGLLLGTSKYLSKGGLNPYYVNRIHAAATLVKSGKIRYLIISGDNGTIQYNEPKIMRADLLKEGIDSSIIYLDDAGFRTFDSMIRLKEIFGQDSVTIISQPFHNERALYIASREHIAAIGFNAEDLSGAEGFKTHLREKFARVKVFLDFWLGKEPRYLGNKIPIPQ